MPTSHLVGMMGPGSYTPRDFLKVGAGMTVVTLAVLLIGMRLFWGV